MNNEQNYTEQPFNLETALKHPEWVRTRDGREIDFIKEYSEYHNDYKVLVIMKNSEVFRYARNGLYQLGQKSNSDLIIRIPYINKYAFLYSDWEYSLNDTPTKPLNLNK